eukprot:TRINITY_DN388_c0_g1_i1.p1 TRINITY_DN388_c0_g1~~TRINITY_DN388_c0_g1_i1.p1  ORF type:complete len:302 (-),score=69.08 TRINITY_DN388_c0_g1_i1:40-822(-)
MGEYILRALGQVFIFITFPLSVWFCFRQVQQYEKAVIFRLGRNLDGSVRGPGLFFFNPLLDEIHTVDLRTITFDIPPQLVLSNDSLSVRVNGVVYYHVADPLKVVNNVMSYHHATSLLAQTTLRNIIGHQTLNETLRLREQLSEQIREILDAATDPWGIKIERVELKDISVPEQMQRSMAIEAEAERDARAKVIAAEGERQAASILRNAAQIMMESPASIQLKQLSTLNNVAAERDSTIYFPIPVELMPNPAAFSMKKLS